MRRGIADWSAAALAIAVMAFGGLIVVKPAIDHWDDVYRGDPFVVGTTTQMRTGARRRQVAGSRPRVSRTTTTTTEDSSSFAERLLGKSGTLLVRLLLVGLVAYLAGAVLQRALLGNYSLRRSRPRPRRRRCPSPPSTGAARCARPRTSRRRRPPQRSERCRTDPARPRRSPRASRSWCPRVARRSGCHSASWQSGPASATRSISRIEGGEHSPSPKTLERLAEVLG